MSENKTNDEIFGKIVTVDENKNVFTNNLLMIDADNIKEEISHLKHIRDLSFLNYNVKEACKQYLSFKFTYQQEGTIHFAEINRLLLTILSSFYAYISFCEKNFPDQAGSIKKELFDNNYEYRLFYNLRRYMEHNGLVIDGRNSIVNAEGISFDYYINKRTLIESSSIQSSFRKELLLNEDKVILLRGVVTKFEDIIDHMTMSFISLFKDKTIEAFKILSSITPHYSCEKILCYIENKETKEKISHFKVMTMTIEALSRCFVYRMNETEKQNIIEDPSSLFRILCSIYYSDENSIPLDSKV